MDRLYLLMMLSGRNMAWSGVRPCNCRARVAEVPGLRVKLYCKYFIFEFVGVSIPQAYNDSPEVAKEFEQKSCLMVVFSSCRMTLQMRILMRIKNQVAQIDCRSHQCAADLEAICFPLPMVVKTGFLKESLEVMNDI